MGDHTSNEQKLQRRNYELAVMNEIAQALNREIDLYPALTTTLAKVAALLSLRTGWIWLLNQETGESYLAASQNLPPGLASDSREMTGTCFCLDTFRSGDMSGAANINVVECSRLRHLSGGTDGLRYHASIPLYAPGGKHLGILNVVDTQWRELSDDDLQLLYTIGDLLSIAIERAWLFSESGRAGAIEERNRLAREIHDTLAQSLAAIALQMETADALFEADADRERIRQRVHKALKLSQSALEDARRSVLDLRAVPLEEHSLEQAVRSLVADLRQRSDIDATFEGNLSSRPLPLRAEIGIYRIVQEALNNTEKHAESQQVKVSIHLTADKIRLDVEDDGRGFNANDIPKGHFGLQGINERVRMMGGAFELKTAPVAARIWK